MEGSSTLQWGLGYANAPQFVLHRIIPQDRAIAARTIAHNGTFVAPLVQKAVQKDQDPPVRGGVAGHFDQGKLSSAPLRRRRMSSGARRGGGGLAAVGQFVARAEWAGR